MPIHITEQSKKRFAMLPGRKASDNTHEHSGKKGHEFASNTIVNTFTFYERAFLQTCLFKNSLIFYIIYTFLT